MKGSRFFKKFSLRWSIEGPLEGYLDLAKDLIGYRPKLNQLIFACLAFCLSIIIFFLASLSLQTLQLYLDFTDMLIFDLLFNIFKIFGTVILIALTSFILLIVFQSYRFLDILYSRFEGFIDLWKGSSEEEAVKKSSLNSPHIDPYDSSLSFTEDVSKEIPQLRKQMGYSSKLFLIAVAFLSIDFVLHISFISFDYGFFLPTYGRFELIWKTIELILIPLSVSGWLFTTRLKDFLDYFDHQFHIIENIREEETQFVPDGEDEAKRFEKYLKERDERLKLNLKRSESNIDKNAEVEGYSGESYRFDLAYIPEGQLDYLLLVKIKDEKELNIECCEEYKQQIDDIIKKLENEYGKRPTYVRAVVLTSSHDDKFIEFDDELVDYILNNPLELRVGPGRGPIKTNIQIVIEEGETYSVFPFLAEDKVKRR